MSAGLATLALITAAWLSFAVATSLAVTLTWRVLARPLRRAHPRQRAGFALAAALAPSLVPTLLVLVCLAPGLAGLLGWHGDHCLSHGDHPHLCLAHLSATLSAPLCTVLVLVGAALAVALRRGAAHLTQTRQHLVALRLAATRPLAPDVSIVASKRPFSVTAGLARSGIWVSAALAEALSEEELHVVLMHERAHLERRDPLRRAAAAAFSFPLWPSVRRAVLSELALASEQACDEEAGRQLGDRLRVAETILSVERLAGASAPATLLGVLAFGGCTTPERVKSLVEDELAASPLRAASWVAFALLVGGTWLVADPLHHITEHWLRLLLGSV